MKKTVVRYGLYGAVTIWILFLISLFLLDNLSFTTQEILGYASMIISLGFVYFGVKHFRDKENEGRVSFKNALIIGILISLITALAFGVLDTIYAKILNPDFLVDYYDTIVEGLRNTLPPDEFEKRLAEINAEKEMFSNPVISFAFMAMTVFVIGFIISLISALILQRK
ncbi:DUF4199 domain-containing protein [Flagellimonas sp. S3867]|uniref:DUF4199 domain-containing protein n=1 Tax=Flagellimonas sp. S3867 TaxID=2768063 RepID=UPI0016835B66|nr:DUF4199 domain-containing protein [Flagellimonas sp. S3867]